MFGNFLESLYNKVLINIVIKRSSSEVYIELISKKETLKQEHKSFSTTTLNEDMFEFISSYIKESPYYYISLLDISTKQGAIPTCNKNKISYYEDLTSSEYKCYEKKWTYFTLKSDIYTMEKRFKKIGIDFIFSPFLLLAHFFKDKINTKLAMYILVQDSALSLCVFEEGELLFARHLDMETVEEVHDELLSNDMHEDDDIDLGSDISIDLEDVDVIDDIESLEDFGDIEDLDSLEEIDEFSENKDIEEELFEAEEHEEESDNSSFNEDYQRYTLIHSSLGSFYNDSRYESKFVENVYIADGVGVSADLKRYLEEEMFLNVYIRQANISMELSELAKRELNI